MSTTGCHVAHWANPSQAYSHMLPGASSTTHDSGTSARLMCDNMGTFAGAQVRRAAASATSEATIASAHCSSSAGGTT